MLKYIVPSYLDLNVISYMMHKPQHKEGPASQVSWFAL